MNESQRCWASIDGPKVGAHVVLWRKYCRNLTRHPSGTCHVHRDPGWYVGKRSSAKQVPDSQAAHV